MKTICIMCPMGCPLEVTEKDGNIFVTGNTCRRGELYGRDEYTCPKRVVTSLVKLSDGGVVSCKTDKQIDKKLINSVLKELSKIRANRPLNIGDILISNVCDSGANIVVTSNVK